MMFSSGDFKCAPNRDMPHRRKAFGPDQDHTCRVSGFQSFKMSNEFWKNHFLVKPCGPTQQFLRDTRLISGYYRNLFTRTICGSWHLMTAKNFAHTQLDTWYRPRRKCPAYTGGSYQVNSCVLTHSSCNTRAETMLFRIAFLTLFITFISSIT